MPILYFGTNALPASEIFLPRNEKLLEHVAFPNRKSIIFDNKLDFSDRKVAIGQGFRYSNFKVASK